MTLKRIPYGVANYRDIREKNCYYLDKTMYIPQLEETGTYLFFIRPRRFGKSLLLSMLACYYDIAAADDFAMLFNGTYIYDTPTPEKNRYLILPFNFSEVNPEPDMVEQSFNAHIRKQLWLFHKKYRHLFEDDFMAAVAHTDDPCHQLDFTLDYLGSIGQKACILIDEYDNFTNTIMATHGNLAYHDVTHGTGVYRFFFNMLKGAAGTNASGVARLFITGVSPITMDDVTSGFNIGKHISLDPRFNELLGFTERDVCDMLDYYGIPVAEALPIMEQWYNNYRFARTAPTALFNTDMVLYFVDQYRHTQALPQEMIDQNVKIDYGKLRHLMVLNKQLNGNFSYLQHILETRQILGADIAVSFPVDYLTRPTNFVSLLFYFGLLSYNNTDGDMVVPNETVVQLLYSYLRDGLDDADVFRLDMLHLMRLMRGMAYDGQWEPALHFLAQEIERQTSIRDYLHGEKVIQTFLLIYLSVSKYYLVRTEHEMGKGFVDVYLEPCLAHYASIRYGYLIEVKYLTRGEWSESLGQQKLVEAQAQLAQYVQAPCLQAMRNSVQLKRIALVYAGWELKLMRECD